MVWEFPCDPLRTSSRCMGEIGKNCASRAPATGLRRRIVNSGFPTGRETARTTLHQRGDAGGFAVVDFHAPAKNGVAIIIAE